MTFQIDVLAHNIREGHPVHANLVVGPVVQDGDSFEIPFIDTRYEDTFGVATIRESQGHVITYTLFSESETQCSHMGDVVDVMAREGHYIVCCLCHAGWPAEED